MQNTADTANLLAAGQESVQVNVMKPAANRNTTAKKLTKYFVAACLVGTISYGVYDQTQPQEDYAIIHDQSEYKQANFVILNPLGDKGIELLEEDRQMLETASEPAMLGATLPVGCSVNVDRLNNQDKVISDWNNNANSRSPYEDDTFGAQKDYTLYWSQYLKDNASIQMYNEGYKDVTSWTRPGDFDKSRAPSLWGDKGILPSGILQGGLGSCYFLAAAAALATHPERIEKIFQNSVYTASGIFMVEFYSQGYPVKIVVDDRFPMYPNPTGRYVDQLFNSKMSPNGAWWGPILEKAYCKMNVNCANINGGVPQESFRALTGMPVEHYTLSDYPNDDDVFDIVVDARGNSYSLVSSCVREVYGLASGHAYALMEGVQLGNNKLLKVMNPWGKEEYVGPWNDKDTRWTPTYKAQVNLVVADDGIFYMPISVFKSAFHDFYINNYRNNWVIDTFHIQKNTMAQTVTWDLTSNVSQEALITLDYQTAREYPPGCTRPTMSNSNINIFIKQGRNTLAQVATFQEQGYTYFKFPGGIKAGILYTIELYDFNGKQPQDFVVRTYCTTSKCELKNARLG